MLYLTIRARNEQNAVIYEKDTDPGVFSPVGSRLRSVLCRQNLMMDCEQYCLHVTRASRAYLKPRPRRSVRSPVPIWIGTVSTASRLIVEDRNAWAPETPVQYFVFLLFTQSRRCCRWDVPADQLDYLRETVEQALLKGGYLAAPGNLRCDFLVREAERPPYDERILLADEAMPMFRVSREGAPCESFPVRGAGRLWPPGTAGGEATARRPLTIFDYRVFDKIMQAAQAGEARREEVAGLLLGQPYRSAGSQGLLVYVRDLIPAMAARRPRLLCASPPTRRSR